MITDTQIAQAIDKFIDKPWGLCCPEEQKWDCLNTMVTFYSELGIEMPLEFEGYKYEDYKEIWNKNFRKALKILKRWYRTLGERINPNFMIRGDLILYDAADKDIIGTAWAIYLGNGNALMVFGLQGVKVLPVQSLKPQLSEVRRLIK